jgi:hypothetical protein
MLDDEVYRASSYELGDQTIDKQLYLMEPVLIAKSQGCTLEATLKVKGSGHVGVYLDRHRMKYSGNLRLRSLFPKGSRFALLRPGIYYEV